MPPEKQTPESVPPDLGAITDTIGNRWWRMSNLYWIRDKQGNAVVFKPNGIQAELDDNLHTRNVVLKSRQHGVTTWACVRGLDMAIFRPNTAVGIVAHTKDDATKFFRDKVLFAYDRLPDWLKAVTPITRRDMTGSIEFGNGSRIDVSVSHRGGTLQFLHVSEYGPLCSLFPQRADEVKSGALNTVPPDCIVTIESTAYGAYGDFYDKVELAKASEAMVASGNAKRSMLDYRLHFFAWWRDGANRLDPDGVIVIKEKTEYFNGIETEMGCTIDAAQRAWYVKKEAEQGDDMMREHPSTPDEAFKGVIEGAYYTRELQSARGEGRIGRVPHYPGNPVNTFWDIGHNDAAAIWFHQQVSLENRFLRSFEKSGEHIPFFVAYLQRMQVEHGYVYGTHYLPHDAESATFASMSARSIFETAMPGQRFEVVPRIAHVWLGVDQTKQIMPSCYFDAVNCADGLQALDSYRKKFDAKHGIFLSEPEHDQFSNYADAFRQFGQGYKPAQKLVKPPEWEKRVAYIKKLKRPARNPMLA